MRLRANRVDFSWESTDGYDYYDIDMESDDDTVDAYIERRRQEYYDEWFVYVEEEYE